MIEHKQIILTGDGLYRVTMDTSEIDSPLDYELTSLNNPDDCFMVTSHTVEKSFNNGKWKVVNLEQLS